MNTEEIRETHNVSIESIAPLPTPAELKAKLPLGKESWTTISEGRRTIPKILTGEDPRLLVIVGSCSMHNIEETEEYSRCLSDLAGELKETLYIVERINFDKPRSRAKTNGRSSWQGFFNDPRMDGSCDLELGFTLARKLLLSVTSIGLPVATEMLEEINYQMIDDLLSFVWVGARDCNSQTKKKVASGASTAVGFKHPIEGSVQVAVDSLDFARHSQVLPAPGDDGRISRFRTKGNSYGVLIHRGFSNRTNYDCESIGESVHLLRSAGLIDRLIVDASHGNSKKDHLNQRGVIMDVAEQIAAGNTHVAGIMYESYLENGNQKIPVNLAELEYGVSVTDQCDGWKRTEETLRMLAEAYSKTLGKK